MFEDIPGLPGKIDLINGLDSNRFRPLMSRVFERLSGNDSVDGKIFSQEEEEKLKKVLGLSSQDDLDALIDCLVSMARKVVYNVSKPKSLLPQLMKIGMKEEKAVPFVQVWVNCSGDKVNQLKKECIGLSPSLLEDVNWKFRVQCNQRNASNMEKIKAEMDLVLIKDAQSGGKREEKHSLEFDLDQLKGFYDQLEDIQSLIDSKILQIP